MVTLGETVCAKLRDIYFANIPWIDCHTDVAARFTHLKIIARNFYTDKSEHEMLIELNKYSQQDILDAFSAEQK